jgi:hypothetical protein
MGLCCSAQKQKQEQKQTTEELLLTEIASCCDNEIPDWKIIASKTPLDQKWLDEMKLAFPMLSFGVNKKVLFDGSKQELSLVFVTTVQDLLHELAHFQVASPGRRKMDNYGLGGDQDLSESALIMSNKEACAEESLASLLGICLEIESRIDPSVTIIEHDWTVCVSDVIKGELEKLKRLGIMVDGKVVWGFLHNQNTKVQEKNTPECLHQKKMKSKSKTL